MKLADLASLPFEARRVVLDALLERLPAWLELVDPSLLQPRFRDARSGEGWRLFSGGTFELGATDERLARVAELQARYPLRLSPARLHLPPRRVTVSPFLLMEQAISERGSSEPAVLILRHEAEAKVLLDARAARLPTQAEWEFAMRAVAAQPEHWVLSELELCDEDADAERVDHVHFHGGDVQELNRDSATTRRLRTVDQQGSSTHDAKMNVPQHYPVCIIGGGPGGCAVPLQLAKHGMKAVLLEKSVFPRDKVCGDALSGKVMRTLERLDADLANRVKRDARARASWGVTFVAPSGRALRVPFTHERYVGKATGAILPCPVLDDLLYQHVKNLDGVFVHESVSAKSFARGPEGCSMATTVRCA